MSVTPEPSAEQVIAKALSPEFPTHVEVRVEAQQIIAALAEAGFSLVKEGEQLTAEEADVAASLLEAPPEGTMSGAWERARIKLRRLASGENPR